MSMTAVISVLLLILGVLTIFANLPTTMTQLLSWLRSISAAGAPPPSSTVPPDAKKTEKVAAGQGRDPELMGVFATFDRDRDGYITKQELKDSLEKMGISMEDGDVAEMVEKVDGNKDGLLDLEEFSALYGEFMGGDHNEGDSMMREAFDVFDGDKDGFISEMELSRVLSSLGLQQGNRLEACKEMIRSVDVDGDGMVNFDEFKRMMMMDGGRLIHVS